MHTDILKADNESMELAAKYLENGQIVAIPTETVYGLAANAYDENAVSGIFKAKGRPQDNPLIIHIADICMLDELIEKKSETAEELIKNFWENNMPAPLTIIFEKSNKVNKTVTAGLSTVAVRKPAHPVMLEIIRRTGFPLAAPSANISGAPSPTSAEHVFKDLNGKIPLIIDGGKCGIGLESTVVKIKENKIVLLRPGIITEEQLRRVSDVEISDSLFKKMNEDEKIDSPGMKYKHYSPKAKIIILDCTDEKFIDYVNIQKENGVIAFIFEEERQLVNVKNIVYGRKNDEASQAAKLFEALRKADTMGAKTIYARCPKKNGIGLALYNRLLRAAGFNIIRI